MPQLPPNTSLIYCDGACSGNPGPGGWGSIVVTNSGQVHELGGGHPSTTNNQMELTAAIEALRELKDRPGEIFLYTDSVYVIRGITQWIWGWQRNGWKTADGKEVSNREHWQELASLVAPRKKPNHITWRYARGHTGIPGNERCDEIAVAYSKGQSIRLYEGSAEHYRFDVNELPKDEAIPDSKFQKGPKPSAHSYLSLLGRTALRHKSWPNCERRVKGQPGAKFKKAMSPAEEIEILKGWGIDPSTLKDE